ncbi:phospholipase D [Diplocarpon rosae]|nr:phospholipase D [Diplocarpon rosae]
MERSLQDDWLEDLKKNAPADETSSPNYWVPDQSTLITTCQPLSFSLGTGAQIVNSTLSKCEATRRELIIVTCFWAKSSSQESICSLLVKLSAKALAQSRKIQVWICFSSRSLTQKLSQTSSLDGKIYPPSTWTSLSLPPPEQLTGLSMDVKSIFVRPFSVMHPKFILSDRNLAFMPSCNVSWENWFEGCIEMRGGITEKLFDFWASFWACVNTQLPELLPAEFEANEALKQVGASPAVSLLKQTNFSPELVAPQTILLPSPHHINPRFRLFCSTSPCPPTPLNLFLLRVFTRAKRTIFIQTPNMTSEPVIEALHAALVRGVDVHLVTSSKLMILEQLVTAGTVTEYEMWKLHRRHRKLTATHASADPETGLQEPGSLKIGYYHAREGVSGENEPVKSHLKLVIVDDDATILGSGNMDRAR